MKIVRPVFIIGIQRSGTTILDNLFTRHKDTAFFEGFCNRYYMTPWKFNLIPFQIMRYKSRPRSTEGRVWRRYFTEIDYVDETQATRKIRNYYYSAMEAELRAFRAKKFVNKNPSHCIRLRWLNAMFPDAQYILIWRDPRAVVHSQYEKLLANWDAHMETEYEFGFKGWVTIKEKFGKNVSKLEAVINYYNFYNSVLLKDLPLIKERTTEVRYEYFIRHPREELKRLYQYTGLQWYDELEKAIPEVIELDNNEKWKSSLKPDEKAMLERAFPIDSMIFQ